MSRVIVKKRQQKEFLNRVAEFFNNNWEVESSNSNIKEKFKSKIF